MLTFYLSVSKEHLLRMSESGSGPRWWSEAGAKCDHPWSFMAQSKILFLLRSNSLKWKGFGIRPLAKDRHPSLVMPQLFNLHKPRKEKTKSVMAYASLATFTVLAKKTTSYRSSHLLSNMILRGWHSAVVVSTVTSQQERPGFDSIGQLDAFFCGVCICSC